MIGEDAIRRVRRTKLASPSKLWLAGRCLLRYILETEGQKGVQLPETPAAVLGIAVHEAIEETLSNKNFVNVDYVDVINRNVNKVLRNGRHPQSVFSYILETHGIKAAITQSLILRQAKFLKLTVEKCRDADVGAEYLSGDHSKASSGKITRVEQWFEDHDRGLAGRIDLLRVNDANDVEIIDFKSGKIFSEDGAVKEEYRIQMAAYGYLVESKYPRSSINLKLYGVEADWESPYGSDLCDNARQLLEKLKLRAPLGADIEMASIATRGDHCSSCAHRMMCPTYLEALRAQIVISNPKSEVNVLYDIFGEFAVMKELDSGLAGIKVTTPEQRVIFIQGIPKRMIDSTCINPGCFVAIFDAKSMEIQSLPGYPTNYTLIDKNMPSRSSFYSSIRIFS
jgi:hypothetical protein